MRPFESMRSLLLLALVSLLSMSSCCSVAGGAINTAVAIHDKPNPARVALYPVTVLALAVGYPALLGCLWVEGARR